MTLKACDVRIIGKKKGMTPLLREFAGVQFVRGVSGTDTIFLFLVLYHPPADGEK